MPTSWPKLYRLTIDCTSTTEKAWLSLFALIGIGRFACPDEP